MPDAGLLAVARRLQHRAEEILARAEAMHNADAREKMRRIAAGYERLARKLEDHASDAGEDGVG